MGLLEATLVFIGLLFFAFISWRRLDWGIYLVVFTLPCYLLRPQIFGIPTTVLELEIYVLSAIWLIKSLQLLDFSFQIKNFLFSRRYFLLPIGLIFLGAVLSTIFSSNLRISLGILKGWFFDPLIFSVLIFFTIKTKKQIKVLLSALSGSGILVAFVSLFYYFSNDLTFDGRLKAFYLSPNHLAMYLAPCFLLTYFLFSAAHLKKLKFFWLGGLFSMALILYLTFSFGAWFGTLSALCFSLWLNFKKKRTFWTSRKKLLYCYIVILLFIIGVSFLQFPTEKIQSLLNFSRSSLESRLMVWQAALKILNNNFILGIGPGMFQEYYLDYQKYFSPYLEWAAPQPHNIFLAFWLQCGIFGLAGFLWLLIRFFKTGFKLSAIGHRSLVIGLMAVMVYILVHGLVDATYWKNDLSVIFWLTVVLIEISNIKN